MKRKLLIKLKNGRHRVATADEVELISDREEALTEARMQRNRALAAQQQVSSAMERGANEIMRNKYLPYAIDKLVIELTRKYGPSLMSAANEILKSGKRNGAYNAPLDITASLPAENFNVLKVHGEIPALHYTINVARY